MDKVNECMFMDMHRQIWYFANDRVFVFKDIKRAQANYRALRVLGLKQLVSYKIQDLDASGTGWTASSSSHTCVSIASNNIPLSGSKV